MGRKPRWRLEADRPFKRTDYETPVPDWVLNTSPREFVAETELEALMVTPPGGTEPPVHVDTGDTYKNLDEILGVELDLSEQERAVLDALYVAGHSMREAGNVLGMSQTAVWRIKESALARVRHRMETIG